MNRRHFYNLFCLCIISTAYALPQRHWTVADGLPTGEVQQIVQLPNGQMLINCEGVFCLSNGHDFDPLPCDYRLAFNLPHYTNRYGQFWEADSILWLRDFYRIYRFDARTYTFAKADENNLKGALLQSILDNKADTPTPTTAGRDSVATIIPITAGRDSVANTTPRLSTLHPHTLPHNQNNITFYFSTLNYATPSHDTYRYRLRPIETQWNLSADRSGQAQATYKALPPGEYTFEVQAANTSGQWGPLTTQTFIITPPWWQTTCAKTIYLLIIISALIAATNLYLKKKRQRLIAENDQRVNRLFELRQQARHQFAASANIHPDKITVNAEEQKLVTMMLKAIQLHINDQQYNADLLARDLAISRASLYKKMQNILGITPTDFIRNVRLKRAAQMLAESQLSITEIAHSVGFATPRNFSASFKKMFGVLPSEYRTGKSSSKE